MQAFGAMIVTNKPNKGLTVYTKGGAHPMHPSGPAWMHRAAQQLDRALMRGYLAGLAAQMPREPRRR